MTVRPILTVPDPVLKQVSKPIESVTDETRALMDDMLETMYAAPGIGLAAIQIGVPLNVIVIDLAREDDQPNVKYFANPEIRNILLTGIFFHDFRQELSLILVHCQEYFFDRNILS